MGFIGAMEGVAIVIAPLLSGAITQHVNWRWCFYLTLPIGGVTILAIAIFFKPPRTHEASSLTFMGKVKEMDLFGMFMLIPSIVCLLLALQWGGTRFAWNSSRIIALLVIFALSFIAFVAIQIWKKDGASLPPRVIKQRGVALGLVYSLCTASALAVMDFYVSSVRLAKFVNVLILSFTQLPIWFQVIKGFSPTQSGVGVLPIIIGLILGSILTGSAVAAIGYYTPAMIGGSVLMSIGSGLITTFTPNTGYSKWIGYQAVIGLGGGMSFQQPMLAVQTILQEKDVPIGTTAVVWANNLGATIFVSIAQNVFSNQLKAGLVKSVPNVDPSIVLSTGATSLKNSIDPTYLRVVITQYNGALIHVFYIALGLTCFGMLLALSMEWKSVKGDGEKNKGSEAEAVKQNQEVGQVDQEKTSLA
jgi:MFS family permease